MYSEQLSLWAQIDNVPSREQFASLEAVVVIWNLTWTFASWAGPDIPSMLANCFPKLCAREILSLDVDLLEEAALVSLSPSSSEASDLSEDDDEGP
ncbi:hypothetical protein B0H21DRAFT_890315 [Amylocystis lapponica]|nr:hypothetical protein B0H21DRAFT_890315 [Amylocystis lapponica]